MIFTRIKQIDKSLGRKSNGLDKRQETQRNAHRQDVCL